MSTTEDEKEGEVDSPLGKEIIVSAMRVQLMVWPAADRLEVSQ